MKATRIVLGEKAIEEVPKSEPYRQREGGHEERRECRECARVGMEG
jgi:hypothetical protein